MISLRIANWPGATEVIHVSGGSLVILMMVAGVQVWRASSVELLNNR
jgi:hypothetical protein